MTACAMCSYDPAAEVVASWTFGLDKRIASANMRTVNVGASRWRYHKERDEWQSWLIKARSEQRGQPWQARPSSKRRVTITRHYAGRCQEMDRDNLHGGVKPLVDAMVREGILHDDDSIHLELHVLQTRDARNMTVVTVEELA